MAISDKLEYLNDTKQLLKDKINNLGGSITSETTFRNYANQLQNVYNNLPKTDYAEGSNITLSNTLKGKLDYENGVVGIGQSEQDSTNGYQMLDITLDKLKTNNSGRTWINNSTTFNGITFTPHFDNNGKLLDIVTTGTATADAILYLISSLTLSAGTYYVSGCPNGGSTSTYFLYTKTNGPHNTTDTITTLTFNEETTFTNNNMRIVIKSGITANNLVWKPMLSQTNTSTYEPYTRKCFFTFTYLSSNNK